MITVALYSSRLKKESEARSQEETEFRLLASGSSWLLASISALPLDPPGPAAGEQLPHFLDAEPVEISRDGVLQTTRGYREFERLLGTLQRLQPINQPARKRVAAPHPVHNVGDLVCRLLLEKKNQTGSTTGSHTLS